MAKKNRPVGDKKATLRAMWRMEFFITATVMKKPHFAQGFVWH